VVAVVAATETEASPSTPDAACKTAWPLLLAASLALPGVAMSQDALSPGPGGVAFKWLRYEDRQPGWDRISVNAPSWWIRSPLGSRWDVEASWTADSVSGASPRYHSSISGASHLREERRAGDLKLTRYGDRSALSAAVAQSDENDFHSRALSAQARWDSDDRNRSWTIGAGLTLDRIGSSDDPSLADRRRTVELSMGLTQALSRTDLVQLQLTHAAGHGHYSDPYKRLDVRPRSRHQSSVSLRWNHHIEATEVTLRGAYRSYRDSFGIRSHTLSVEPVWPVTARVTLTPSLRLYTQTAARFYYDPVYSFAGAPYPPGYLESPPQYLSPDQRLSAFGAVTLGLKFALAIDEHWQGDIKVERYEQRSAWRVGGAGSPGLAPFSARFITLGAQRSF
jgi:Protein of unknown function (DUF3570)